VQHSERRRPDLFSVVTSAATATLPAPSRLEGRFSAHAAQLRAGFRWLRFAPELEREFQRFIHARYLIRTRIALVGGAVLLGAFALRDMRLLPEAVWHVTVALRLLVMVPAVLLVLAASFVPRLAGAFEWITATGVSAVMGALALAVLHAGTQGSPLPYEGLMVVMIFAIFLCGLRFYAATAVTVATAAAYLAGRVALELPGAETSQQAYYMFVITLIGLVGSYSLELSQRANFLTEHVAMFRATRDAMTHLYNRRAAMDHLDRAWRLAFRERKPVAVALIDVDHFKPFNDRYGHSQGDACLAEVAAVLRDRVRRHMDMVARYGGEEFIAVVYDAGEAALRVICEDIRHSVRALHIAHGGNGPHEVVTVSVGAALAEPAGGVATIESLIERADQALYRAKAAGRDRCELQDGRRGAAVTAREKGSDQFSGLQGPAGK
jgi:diguanylate cyclase (GGDEF)-like protein